MKITASYIKDGSIKATIDGVKMTVPDDIANRHRAIIAKWEDEGNNIKAYEKTEALTNY